MKAAARLALLGGIVGALGTSTASISAQSFSLIKSFGVLSNATGLYPQNALTRGADGTLYGVISASEGNARGSVFKIQPDGSGFTVLKLFTNSLDGANPICTLALDGNTLYGTTQSGGASNYANGTVFKINTDGSGFSVIKSFEYTGDLAGNPLGNLVLSGSTLYGAGLASYGGGAVFKVETNGTGYAVLKTLGFNDGYYPSGGVVLDGNTLYGTASYQGQNGGGTLFKVNTDGSGFAVLRHFSGTDGQFPQCTPLVVNGLVYGVTPHGGSSERGVLFRVDTNGGGFTILRHFPTTAGGQPSAGLIHSDGNLFGTTATGTSPGTVFRIGTNGTGYTTLYTLPNTGTNGTFPQASLLLSSNILYGAALYGGNSGVGTLFKLATNGTGFTVLKHIGYSDAVQPFAGVTQIGDSLYGTTYSGSTRGLGALFKVGTNGTGYTIMVTFARTNGANPKGDLTAVGNVLYGTTDIGGSGGHGTVFTINANGTGFKTLKNYTANNGRSPNGGLVIVGDMIYGTTASGGSTGAGTVFKMKTNGTGYLVLKTFPAMGSYPGYVNSDGAIPNGSLVLSGNSLYGTTANGGSGGRGTVFKVNTNGTGFTVLRNFGTNDGYFGSAPLAIADGTLFGEMSYGGAGYGTIFRLNLDGSGYSVLKSLDYYDGQNPRSGLTVSGGMLYGTAPYGGPGRSGTVFRLSTNGTGFTVLKGFSYLTNNEGMTPSGAPRLNGSTLYGTTYYGGTAGDGSVYALTLSPAFDSQPVSLTVTSGFPASFSASVQGDASPSYQWWKGASPLAGETNAAYTIASTTTNDAGNYFVVVTNLYGSATSTTAVLTVASGLPVITSQPTGTTNIEGSPISFSVAANGAPPLNYQWRKDAAPLLDETNTTFTINSVVTNDAGNYTVIVSNGFGSVTSAIAVLGVISGAPVVLTNPKSATNLVGTAVNFAVTASGTSPLSFQWWKDVTLQTGKTNSTYGIANVGLGDAGNYFVIVTNNYGSATSTIATLTIGCPAVTVNPTTLSNSLVGAAYSRSLTATGGTAPYSFAVTGGALPGGLNLSGAGLLSGTTTNSGAFNFTVTATDSNTCTGARSYAITVSCPTITVAPPSLPATTVGAAYAATNSASGGTAPYTFAITSGSLPGGLTLANGIVSGTPTNTGDFNFTITATDTNGCSANRNYSVSVGCATITFSPDSLPNGASETPYSQTLIASGGLEPYNFTISSGALPLGWSLSTNGLLSGTTTNLGQFNFTITATDVNNCAGTQTYALTVNDVPHPTNMTWIATTEADWDEPDNWSPQQVPGPLDTAIIPTGTDIFIGPDIVVSNVNLSGASARLVGNSLTVLGTMNWSGGMVSNSVIIASNATAIWTSGDLEAQFTVAPGGTLYISNSVTLAYNNWNYGLTNDRVVLTNRGTVYWSSQFYGYGQAQIYNAGLWDCTGNLTMNNQVGTNRFINTGTFRKSGGTSGTVQWHFNTTGNLEVTNSPIVITDWFGTNIINGTLNLSGGSMRAPINIASNAQLNWTGGYLDSLMTVDPGGLLVISNGVGIAFDNWNLGKTNFVALTNNGTVRWTADIYGYGRAHIINNGLWDNTGIQALNVSVGTNLFLNTGTFRKSGGATANLQWFFGTTGLMDVTNGSLSIAKWTNNSVLNGVLNLSGGSISAPLNIASNAQLNWISGNLDSLMTVDPGGLLVISNIVGMAYDNWNLGKTNFVALTNNGTVRWTADLYGYGRAHIINHGLWDTTGNQVLNVSVGTNLFLNTGTFRKSGGTTASLHWFFGTTGLMDVTNGSLSITKWTNNSTLNGVLNLSGGSISAPLLVASNATLNWSGGDLGSLMTIAPGGLVAISNTVTLAYNNWNLGQTNFIALTNHGTVNWAGDPYGYGRAVIYNAGLWQDAGNHTVQQTTGTNEFVNVGTLQKTGGTGLSSIQWIFTQAGQFDVLSGNFSLTGAASQTDGTTTLNGGRLSVTTPFALLGGTLRGTTNVTGSLTNSATVSPGLSPGQLTVTSAYTQTSNGVLQIELGGYAMGTNSDKLVVSGAANLNGAVNFSLINSFVPTNGAAFTFLTCGSRTGTFTNVTLPPQLGGTLSNAATFVMLRITNVQAVITAPVVVYGPLVTNGDFVVRFLGTAGETYTVERTAPLVPLNWQKLTNLLAPPTDLGHGVGVFEVRDPVSATTNRFYRTVHPPY